jgi:hypothetical protein
MALALNNAQGELHPLEVGLHALRSGMSQRAYEERSGTSRRTLRDYIAAAEVWAHMRPGREIGADRWRHLGRNPLPTALAPACAGRAGAGGNGYIPATKIRECGTSC